MQHFGQSSTKMTRNLLPCSSHRLHQEAIWLVHPCSSHSLCMWDQQPGPAVSSLEIASLVMKWATDRCLHILFSHIYWIWFQQVWQAVHQSCTWVWENQGAWLVAVSSQSPFLLGIVHEQLSIPFQASIYGPFLLGNHDRAMSVIQLQLYQLSMACRPLPCLTSTSTTSHRDSQTITQTQLWPNHPFTRCVFPFFPFQTPDYVFACHSSSFFDRFSYSKSIPHGSVSHVLSSTWPDRMASWKADIWKNKEQAIIPSILGSTIVVYYWRKLAASLVIVKTCSNTCSHHHLIAEHFCRLIHLQFDVWWPLIRAAFASLA